VGSFDHKLYVVRRSGHYQLFGGYPHDLYFALDGSHRRSLAWVACCRKRLALHRIRRPELLRLWAALELIQICRANKPLGVQTPD